MMRLTLTNGEQYALDLTNPQYGWKENLFHWNKYLHHRVDRVNWLEAFGRSKTLVNNAVSMYPPESPEGAESILRCKIIGSLVNKIKHRLNSKGLNVVNFLNLPAGEYPAARQDICSFWKTELAAALQDLSAKGIGRLFLGLEGACYMGKVTLTEAKARYYQQVWLTEKEFKDCKGNIEKMKTTWERKLKNRVKRRN